MPAPIAYNFWAINGAQAAFGSGKGAVMDWARLLAYVTGTVDQELLARTERKPHLTAKAQLKGRLRLSDASEPRLARSDIVWAAISSPRSPRWRSRTPPGLVPHACRPQIRWLESPAF